MNRFEHIMQESNRIYLEKEKRSELADIKRKMSFLTEVKEIEKELNRFKHKEAPSYVSKSNPLINIDDYNKVSKAIKEYRKSHKMTQSLLAKTIKVPHGVLSRFENNEAINLRNFKRIRKYLIKVGVIK